MPFCSKCGNQISDNDMFCAKCGAPKAPVSPQMPVQTQRTTTYEGAIHKCPNCGEVVGAFTAQCPACGFEFRDAKASSAVKEFERQLQEIESRRTSKTTLSGVAQQFTDVIGIKRRDNTDEQKLNLIRNFTVPNTKEDVFEFMILAASNIDDSAQDANKSEIEKNISAAWKAKTEQVYNKAKLTFGTEPDFIKIQSIYDAKMRAIKKNKTKSTLTVVAALGGMIAIMAGCLVLINVQHKKEDRIEQQLNEVVAAIQVDIENHDYDSALIKANTLHFDSSLSKSKAEDWDEQREQLIELIEEKKAEDK